MRLFLLSMYFCCALAGEQPKPTPFEIPNWFKPSFLNINEDIHEAQKQNKRLLIFIHQDNCFYCAKFIQNNLGLSNISEYLQTHFEIIEMNLLGNRDVSGAASLGIDQTVTEKQFCQHLQIWATPTLLFFDEYGKITLRLNGYVEPSQFMNAMRSVTEKNEK